MKEQCLVLDKSSEFYDAIKKLDANGDGVLPVIDNNGFFIGLVTDGDVRRAVLNKQLDLEYIVNKNPYKLTIESTIKERIIYLKQVKRRHLPIVDQDNRLIDVFTLDSVDFRTMPNSVVIMAGGLGKRLGELTKSIPKPMLKVGKDPLLEVILLSFIERGFYKFYISVNFKKEIIMSYFGDGSKWGVDIKYLIEDKRLGTAGSLSLIKEKQVHPLIVTNGDVMTSMDHYSLLKHHVEQKSKATMCVRIHEYAIPYGVVEVEGYEIKTLLEKPIKSFNINAGIYAIEPEIIETMPKDIFYDMTTLFEDIAKTNQTTCVFFLKDYWIDVGQAKELNQANMDINVALSEK
ncbi:nucleotidyltransferase family protein [Candidatus Thioglobus sp.]|nr:nucleotidyltransferase family protein [Candidatus Thioglobus sp.]